MNKALDKVVGNAWLLSVLVAGSASIGCGSGAPAPTVQTARSGMVPKNAINQIKNDPNMPDFMKRKRMKVLQGNTGSGG